MAKEFEITNITNAEPGFRAIYLGPDGSVLERPVCAWALGDVYSRGVVVDTEVRAVLSRLADSPGGHGPVLELAGDDCLGYAEPGRSAADFAPGVALDPSGRPKVEKVIS